PRRTCGEDLDDHRAEAEPPRRAADLLEDPPRDHVPLRRVHAGGPRHRAPGEGRRRRRAGREAFGRRVRRLCPRDPGDRLGRRAAAVNLSDLAAVGASPEAFLLGIAYPPERGEEFPVAVARGAASRGEPFGARLVGGDLSAAPVTVISIAMWGRPAAPPL